MEFCYFCAVRSFGHRIYSSDNKLISNGREEDGEQIGYPLSPDSMDVYIKAIVEGSRHINKKQLDVLRKKIVYCDEHY